MSVPEIERLHSQSFSLAHHGEPRRVVFADRADELLRAALARQRREILAVLAEWDDALPASLDYSTAVDFIESRFGGEEGERE